MTKTVVKQDPEKEIPIEVLADAIIAISEGVKKLRTGRLQDRTLCMLIADAAPNYGKYPKKVINQRDVKAVLDGIEALVSTHIKRRLS